MTKSTRIKVIICVLIVSIISLCIFVPLVLLKRQSNLRNRNSVNNRNSVKNNRNSEILSNNGNNLTNNLNNTPRNSSTTSTIDTTNLHLHLPEIVTNGNNLINNSNNITRDSLSPQPISSDDLEQPLADEVASNKTYKEELDTFATHPILIIDLTSHINNITNNGNNQNSVSSTRDNVSSTINLNRVSSTSNLNRVSSTINLNRDSVLSPVDNVLSPATPVEIDDDELSTRGSVSSARGTSPLRDNEGSLDDEFQAEELLEIEDELIELYDKEKNDMRVRLAADEVLKKESEKENNGVGKIGKYDTLESGNEVDKNLTLIQLNIEGHNLAPNPDLVLYRNDFQSHDLDMGGLDINMFNDNPHNDDIDTTIGKIYLHDLKLYSYLAYTDYVKNECGFIVKIKLDDNETLIENQYFTHDSIEIKIPKNRNEIKNFYEEFQKVKDEFYNNCFYRITFQHIKNEDKALHRFKIKYHTRLLHLYPDIYISILFNPTREYFTKYENILNPKEEITELETEYSITKLKILKSIDVKGPTRQFISKLSKAIINMSSIYKSLNINKNMFDTTNTDKLTFNFNYFNTIYNIIPQNIVTDEEFKSSDTIRTDEIQKYFLSRFGYFVSYLYHQNGKDKILDVRMEKGLHENYIKMMDTLKGQDIDYKIMEQSYVLMGFENKKKYSKDIINILANAFERNELLFQNIIIKCLFQDVRFEGAVASRDEDTRNLFKVIEEIKLNFKKRKESMEFFQDQSFSIKPFPKRKFLLKDEIDTLKNALENLYDSGAGWDTGEEDWEKEYSREDFLTVSLKDVIDYIESSTNLVTLQFMRNRGFLKILGKIIIGNYGLDKLLELYHTIFFSLSFLSNLKDVTNLEDVTDIQEKIAMTKDRNHIVDKIINGEILDGISYNKDLDGIVSWIHEWILDENTSANLIENFIALGTGATSLTNDSLKIKSGNRGVIAFGKTCFNTIEINYDIVKNLNEEEKQELNNQQAFIKLLESILNTPGGIED